MLLSGSSSQTFDQSLGVCNLNSVELREGDWDLSGRVDSERQEGDESRIGHLLFPGAFEMHSSFGSNVELNQPDDSCFVNVDFNMRASGLGFRSQTPTTSAQPKPAPPFERNDA